MEKSTNRGGWISPSHRVRVDPRSQNGIGDGVFQAKVYPSDGKVQRIRYWHPLDGWPAAHSFQCKDSGKSARSDGLRMTRALVDGVDIRYEQRGRRDTLNSESASGRLGNNEPLAYHE